MITVAVNVLKCDSPSSCRVSSQHLKLVFGMNAHRIWIFGLGINFTNEAFVIIIEARLCLQVSTELLSNSTKHQEKQHKIIETNEENVVAKDTETECTDSSGHIAKMTIFSIDNILRKSTRESQI